MLRVNKPYGLFTPSDSITDPIMLMGKMGMQPILCPSKKSKVPPVNVTVTMMDSLGVDGPLTNVQIHYRHCYIEIDTCD